MPHSLNWRDDKADFIEYLTSKRYSTLYSKSIVSYLTKHVESLSEPMDVVRISAKLTSGQQHNLNRALSALLSFYEIKGCNPDFINALRKAIPKDNIGVDLNIPAEQEIAASLCKLSTIPLKYRALYNLLLDSGLRLTEAVAAINKRPEALEVNGFYRMTLGYFRASKLAYAGYFSELTFKLIQSLKDKVEECGARRYYQKYGFVTPKYLRKFAFDKMVELEVPESVADFIEGRAPKRIGARHYMAIARQADKFYGRYVSYLSTLLKGPSKKSEPLLSL
jgi:intergrase/recombinase